MAVAVPIAMAAASAYSAYAANKKSKEEKAGMAGQTAAGKALLARGGEAFGGGMPGAKAALDYYQTLLHGSRAAMSQAVAGPTAQITDLYRGAQSGVERSGVRGGVKDLAMANLGRDQANQLGQLTAGVQPGAAAQLGNLGTTLTAQGTGSTATAGGIYGNIGAMGFQQRQYGNQVGAQAGQDIGSAIFQIWRSRQQGGGGSQGGQGGEKPTGPAYARSAQIGGA